MAQARYLLTTPFDGQARQAFDAACQSDPDAAIVKRLGSDTCVVTCAARAASILDALPDVKLETDQPLTRPGMPGLRPNREMHSRVGLTLKVLDPLGRPIPEVTVFAYGDQSQFRAQTGSDGVAEIGLPKPMVSHLIVSPASNFWSRIVDPSGTSSDALKTTLAPLDPGSFSRQLHGLVAHTPSEPPSSRSHIKVAVIDSGVAAHPAIALNGGYNTVDALSALDAWHQDDSGHGTHCAGIIAADDTAAGYKGLAPGVQLFSVRVFPGGFVSDLIEALDWCVANDIDIANMSLSSPNYSEALDLAVQRAHAAGVTIVAAAGNQGRRVAYPARLPHTIGVSAYGHSSMFPDSSAHALRVGLHHSAYGGIFSARFSNRGAGVSVTAPGVAMVSTVPNGYAAWDGTSMAAPVVTAHLASALARVKMAQARAPWQSTYLHHLAATQAWTTGLPPSVEGSGQLLFHHV